MKKGIIFLSAVTLILIGCSEATQISKLEEKRTKLKNELADIEKKIAEMDTTSNSTPAALVSLAPVELTEFVHNIDVQGNIETEKDALVNAESNGVIREVLVKEGQRVSKGQALVRIDASIISDNIQELKTGVDFAQYNYDKQKELFDKGVGSEFQLKQAKNNLDNLKEKLTGLQTQRSKYTVVAPFDGVIDEVFPKIGEMAGPQSPVVRLVNNREVKVTAEISERLYSRIKVGTPVQLTVPSLGDTTVSLTITNIGNYIHPTNRTFRIQAALKENKILLPNMLAQVQILDYKNEEAIVVPTPALLKDRDNNSYVFVADSKEGQLIARRVNVKVVESYNGMSEVNGDLSVEDQVVLKGAKGVSEGDYLRVK